MTRPRDSRVKGTPLRDGGRPREGPTERDKEGTGVRRTVQKETRGEVDGDPQLEIQETSLVGEEGGRMGHPGRIRTATRNLYD